MEDTRALLQKADAFNKKINANGKKNSYRGSQPVKARERKGMAASTMKVLVIISLFLIIHDNNSLEPIHTNLVTKLQIANDNF